MLIRILRSTVALVDGTIRPVDAGELVDVDARTAATLIGLGKAEFVPDTPATEIETPEAALPLVEVRSGKFPRKGKRNE